MVSPPHLHRLLLLLLPLVVQTVGGDSPVAHVAQGQVRGRRVDQPGAEQPEYYAFEGIRFASAPVGDRRFKNPEESTPWSGIWNATAAGPVCVQKSRITNKVEGAEDCLFINVYTASPPESWPVHKLPVVVWVHMGAFECGSGNLDLLRPDALLQKEVIVVSFNYRLGVLGFLNTENPEAPGNAGLKDALLALRWVQRNIAAFGGDNERVTVFGNGAMVNYLLMAPESQGLIHGAMSMGGSALAPWASTSSPRQSALALRQTFNASCPDGDGIVTCLLRIDAAELIDSASSVNYHFLKPAFVPSVEAPGSSSTPFITAAPDQLMTTGRYLHVPYTVGFTNAEAIISLWLIGAQGNSSLWESIEQHFDDFQWPMPPGLQTSTTVHEMRKFYLGNRSLLGAGDDLDTVQRFVQMCSDVLVTVSSASAARLMSQSGSKVYMYEFVYEGPTPFFKNRLYNASDVPGVAHGDELFYLFELGLQPGDPPVRVTPTEKAVRTRWVQMFTNFAKTGNPTPRSFQGSPKWKRYTSKRESYMRLDKTLSMEDHILDKRISFWRQLARCEIPDVCEQRPIVRIEQGAVQGVQQQSVGGCSYYKWKGLPYAKPPLGPLRFKDAQSPDPWQGVRDAAEDGNVCIQPGLTSEAPGVSISGNEDCLVINVYSPHMPTWLLDPLPVMLWIHGGAFLIGSGNQPFMGPDFIVCESVIMVTFNYRLGPLGFLYMEEAAPGNVGLKDQVQAQRWVQRNIAAFLGQPQRVTLVGNSGGGASVHLQMLSPLTKGLFQRAMAMSGSAVARWAIQTAPLETSRRLAAAVGCDRNDSFAAVDCLREVPPAELWLAIIFRSVLTDVDRNRILPLSFVPTVDFPVPGEEQFLPAPANDLILNNRYSSVPFLTGFTSRESLLDLWQISGKQMWHEVWMRHGTPRSYRSSLCHPTSRRMRRP